MSSYAKLVIYFKPNKFLVYNNILWGVVNHFSGKTKRGSPHGLPLSYLRY